MRFNPADRDACKTCIAKAGHHLTRAIADGGDFNAVVAYGGMLASMSGVFLDLRVAADHPALARGAVTGYAAGNFLAAQA